MYRIIVFLLLMFAGVFHLSAQTNQKYFADKNLKRQVAKDKALYLQTVTYDSGIIKTEVTDIKTGKIISRTALKGQEPVGTWLVETENGTEELDYDFKLVYNFTGLGFCSELMKKSKPGEFKTNRNDTPAAQMNAAFPVIATGEPTVPVFIKNNLRYPSEAKTKKLNGEVFIMYKVKETGEIYDVSVTKGANIMLDKEAMRVMKKLRFTTPFLQNGKPMAYCEGYPVNFSVK